MSTTPPPPADDPQVGLLDVDEEVSQIVLDGQAADPGNYPRGTFRKTVSGMITVIVMIVATYVIPGLHWAQPWTPGEPVPFWNLIGRELLGEGEEAASADAETRKLAELALAEVAAEEGDDEDAEPFETPPVAVEPKADEEPIPALVLHEDDSRKVERRLENPERLDPFYAALTRTDLHLPGAVTRASHYGDSAVGNDGITAAIRAKMQARFGDAGHGFHLLGQPNASYKHKGVTFVEKSRWGLCFIIHGCRSDGRYGFGGTTFESSGGAEIRLGTATKGPMGRRVSRFEVYYAAQPGGGTLRLRVDEEPPIEIATAAEAIEDRWEVIEVPDGEHALSVRAAGGGKVRAYGVTLEREGPGVVWDGLSQIGALTRRLLNFDKDHYGGQIARRDPDLLVLMFGGNDMNTKGTMAKYKGEMAEVIRLMRAGKTPMACLVMAPLDHGERVGQQIVTREIVPRLVKAQREVAEAEGCAFFDTYEAMGGAGSMGRWFRSNPKLGSGDLSHLTHHGHKVIGAMLYRALMAGYRDFRRRVEGQPMGILEAIASGEAEAPKGSGGAEAEAELETANAPADDAPPAVEAEQAPADDAPPAVEADDPGDAGDVEDAAPAEAEPEAADAPADAPAEADSEGAA